MPTEPDRIELTHLGRKRYTANYSSENDPVESLSFLEPRRAAVIKLKHALPTDARKSLLAAFDAYFQQ